MDLVRKAFYWFFPAIPKKVWNEEGKNMQRIMLIQTLMHFGFFFISLMFIGFFQMLIDLAYMTFAFTVYLNLREYMIVLYILSMISGAIYKF